MLEYISFQEPEVPHEAERLFNRLQQIGPVLQSARATDGGISQRKVLEAARVPLEELGFTVHKKARGTNSTDRLESAATSDRFDAYHVGCSVALTIHGGRAWTNNEAAISVLYMAAAQGVRIGAVVAPGHYKRSVSADKVADFLRELSRWDGVRLDLEGVAVVSY